MRRFFPLLALFAAGVAASIALAAPPPGHGPPTSSSSTSTGPGNSGAHGPKAKCHPVNLKGTVTGGTISLQVTKADPHSQQLLNGTATLKVDGKVSVQAWSCTDAGSTGSSALFLRQLHVGGKPQTGSTTATTTTSSP